MAIKPFRRKKRIDIIFSRECGRMVYVIDFKGDQINGDLTSLCYLRIARDILRFHYGTGTWRRSIKADYPEIKENRRPYLVMQGDLAPNHSTFLTQTGLFKHIEEIHAAAERLYSYFIEHFPNSSFTDVLDVRWNIYS